MDVNSLANRIFPARRTRNAALLVGILILFSASPTFAVQWTNTTSGNYLDGVNWSGGVVPTAAQSAEFTLASGSQVLWGTNDTTSAGLTVGNGDFVFAGCCGAPGIPYTHTIDGDFEVQNNGSLTLGKLPGESMNVTVTGLTTVNANSLVDLVGGTFSASGEVLVDGGTLRRGSATFNLATGNKLTAQAGGLVEFTGNYFVINDTELEFKGGADLTVTSYLDVGNGTDGALIVDGPGSSLTTNTASATFLDWGRFGGKGTVTVRNAATATINSSRIDFARSGNVDSSGKLSVETGAEMTVNSLNVASGASGNGEIQVTGASSKLTQSATADFTLGGTDSSTANLAIGSGGKFTMGGGTRTVNPTGVIEVLSGGTLEAAPGVLTINGGQLLFQSGSIPTKNILQDTTVSNNGLLEFESNLTVFDIDMNVNSGGTLRSNYFEQQANSILTIDSGNLEVDTTFRLITGSVAHLTEGTIEAQNVSFETGTNIHHTSGTLKINGGTLTRPAGNYAIQGTGADATVHFTGAGASNIAGEISVGDAGELILEEGYDLAATGLLVNSGDLQIRGGGSYSGGDVQFYGGGGLTTVSVDGPTSRVDSELNIAIGFDTESSRMTLSDGATLAADNNIFTGLNGRLEGDGLLVPGNTFVNAGVTAPGQSIGSIGSIVVNGNAALDGVGSLEIELGGANPGEFDLLVVTGFAGLAGALEVTFLDNFIPQIGDTFEILASGGLVSEFDIESLPADFVWNVDYGVLSEDALTLEVLARLGDMNGDSQVTEDDVNPFVQALTDRAAYDLNGYSTNPDLAGDVNEDGQFNFGDIAVFKSMISSASASSSTTVPEPSSLGMLIVALVAGFGTRLAKQRSVRIERFEF